jgi:hypothetical protein
LAKALRKKRAEERFGGEVQYLHMGSVFISKDIGNDQILKPVPL